MNTDAIILPVYFVCFFSFMVWLIWYFLQRKKVKSKFELQSKLIDKFKGVEDLKDFFSNDSGKTFLKSLNFSNTTPKSKILSSITLGIVVGFVGIASVIIQMVIDLKDPIFLVLGILLIAVSLGYLSSTIVAYRLSKKWGLFDKP